MDDNKYLFSQKWKNILVVIFVMSLSFLDKVIPPLGIPIAIIAIFILFKWKKTPIKYLGIFRPQSWLFTWLYLGQQQVLEKKLFPDRFF